MFCTVRFVHTRQIAVHTVYCTLEFFPSMTDIPVLPFPLNLPDSERTEYVCAKNVPKNIQFVKC